MNKEAITRHDIYRKLYGFSEQDLQGIADFIDFKRHQKRLEDKKFLRLRSLLKGHDIDLFDLTRFKEGTWRHVEEEFDDG